MRSAYRAVAVLLACCALALAGCGGGPAAPAAAPQDVGLAPVAELPTKPDDAAWSKVPEFVAPLRLQDMVEPRLLQPSTAEVRVKGLVCGGEAAFRLEWKDASVNDLPGPARFCDACAIQIPAKAESTVPAPQMGELNKTVAISYWNAGWQATVNGRPDTIAALYPNATVDHYPFQAASLKEGTPDQTAMALRYAPARALGNMQSGPRTSPVQDLIAEGPGTITPAPKQESKGLGQRTDQGWAVVIVRHLPEGYNPQTGSQVAFAIWDGAREEVGARKMRSAWIPLVTRVK